MANKDNEIGKCEQCYAPGVGLETCKGCSGNALINKHLRQVMRLLRLGNQHLSLLELGFLKEQYNNLCKGIDTKWGAQREINSIENRLDTLLSVIKGGKNDL